MRSGRIAIKTPFIPPNAFRNASTGATNVTGALLQWVYDHVKGLLSRQAVRMINREHRRNAATIS